MTGQGVRRRGREAALQLLYQVEFTGDASEEAVEEFWRSRGGSSADERAFAESLVWRILADRERIDRIIDSAADNWQLERIARTDLNLLRLGVAEMTGPQATPPEIVMNEAVEIAKKYCDAASAGFINGILDRVARDLRESEARTDEKP